MTQPSTQNTEIQVTEGTTVEVNTGKNDCRDRSVFAAVWLLLGAGLVLVGGYFGEARYKANLYEFYQFYQQKCCPEHGPQDGLPPVPQPVKPVKPVRPGLPIIVPGLPNATSPATAPAPPDQGVDG